MIVRPCAIAVIYLSGCAWNVCEQCQQSGGQQHATAASRLRTCSTCCVHSSSSLSPPLFFLLPCLALHVTLRVSYRWSARSPLLFQPRINLFIAILRQKFFTSRYYLKQVLTQYNKFMLNPWTSYITPFLW